MKNLILILLIIPILSLSQNDTLSIYFTGYRDLALEDRLINKANKVFNKYDIIVIKTNVYSDKYKIIKAEIYNCKYFTEEDEYGDKTTYSGESYSSLITLAAKTQHPESIFIHEIGHEFGWNHCDLKGYLMYYRFISYPIILSPKNIEWFSSERRKRYFHPKIYTPTKPKNKGYKNYSKNVGIVYS